MKGEIKAHPRLYGSSSGLKAPYTSPHPPTHILTPCSGYGACMVSTPLISSCGGHLWRLKSREGPQTHSPWGPYCVTAWVSQLWALTIDLLQRLNEYKEPGSNSAICLLSSFFHDMFFKQNQGTQCCLGGDSMPDGKSPGCGVRPLGFKPWLRHVLAGDL